eukprot:scaffold70339_cov129-Cyclotella_meneghiniana.AAC.1
MPSYPDPARSDDMPKCSAPFRLHLTANMIMWIMQPPNANSTPEPIRSAPERTLELSRSPDRHA